MTKSWKKVYLKVKKRIGVKGRVHYEKTTVHERFSNRSRPCLTDRGGNGYDEWLGVGREENLRP